MNNQTELLQKYQESTMEKNAMYRDWQVKLGDLWNNPVDFLSTKSIIQMGESSIGEIALADALEPYSVDDIANIMCHLLLSVRYLLDDIDDENYQDRRRLATMEDQLDQIRSALGW